MQSVKEWMESGSGLVVPTDPHDGQNRASRRKAQREDRAARRARPELTAEQHTARRARNKDKRAARKWNRTRPHGRPRGR